MLTMIIIVVVCFITFCATPLGRDLILKLERFNAKKEKEKYIESASKFDPLIKDEYLARQKTIAELKEKPEVQLAYSQYKLSLKRRQVPMDIEEFIEKVFIEPNAGVGQFKLNLDEHGNIISVELEGYGTVPLELVKEYEPRCYAQIMQEYEKFKRENNLS